MTRRSPGFNRQIVLARKLGKKGVKLLRHGGGGPRRIEKRVRTLRGLAGRKRIGVLSQSVTALGTELGVGDPPKTLGLAIDAQPDVKTDERPEYPLGGRADGRAPAEHFAQRYDMGQLRRGGL